MLYSKVFKITTLLFSLIIAGFFLPHSAEAHCDTANGPVAEAASNAMADGNVADVLIWVSPEEEDELKSIYKRAMKVYAEGGAAGELAKRYLIENTVRLHRRAEGMSYTGLKPAQPEPIAVQTAEEALDTGTLKPVTGLLSDEMEKKATTLFNQARNARKHKDESVAAGRKWVDAYVKYIIYTQGLYTAIQNGPAHGVGK
ncbi:MAG TPA: DUF6448 family protein [Balneolales bacterium]|nr:DUF6448 family protein [Balneolales bacterium]